MTNTIGHIVSNPEGMEHCYQCSRLPEVKIESSGTDTLNVVLECRLHGHVAMGDSIKQAVKHWNHYILFMQKAA